MANKKDLTNRVAENLEISKAEAKKLIDALLEEVSGALIQDGEVNLTPLGKLVVVERAARKGRNPQTGEELDIPATNAPKFRARKNLKELVKNI